MLSIAEYYIITSTLIDNKSQMAKDAFFSFIHTEFDTDTSVFTYEIEI